MAESAKLYTSVPFMEVLEHFSVDPMYAMSELNRITTPNIASWVSLHKLLNFESPYIFGVYGRTPSPDRHNREYSVNEAWRLAEAAGFGIERLEAITAYPHHDAVEPVPGVNPWNRG